MRFFLILALIFGFFGCAKQQQNTTFSSDKTTKQALINTKKKEFSLDKKRFLLMATYLNPIEDINITNDYENFLVNLHVSQKYNLIKNIKQIALNNDKNTTISDINASSSTAKLSPSYNKWGKYFIIKAPKKQSKKLKLFIEIEDFGFELNFVKDILK